MIGCSGGSEQPFLFQLLAVFGNDKSQSLPLRKVCPKFVNTLELSSKINWFAEAVSGFQCVTLRLSMDNFSLHKFTELLISALND